MPGTAIGVTMNLGYPGNRSRNDPSDLVTSRQVKAATPVLFGVPVRLNTDNSFDAMVGTDTMANFAGIALRNVKQATVYATNASGQYNQNEACDAMVKGFATVSVNTTASLTSGGAVFAIFNKTTGAFVYFDGVTGDGTTTEGVQLTNCKWTTGIVDANYIAEMSLLTANVA